MCFRDSAKSAATRSGECRLQTGGMIGQRRGSLWVSSLILLAVALAILFMMIRLADVDWAGALSRVTTVSAGNLALMLLLAIIQTWLGAEKWRLVQSAQAESPGHLAAFSLSAIGVGLGQVLPSQIAASVARGLGAKWLRTGSAIRGGLASLYEQAFDVVIVVSLAGSIGIAVLFPENGVLWGLCAATGLTIGLAVTLWVAGRIDDLRDPARVTRPQWLSRLLSRVAADGYVSRALVLRLFLFSAARFAMVGIVCIVMSHALGFDIPAWKIVAALPLPLIALAIASTPGGIGVNELAMASGLMLLGVPADTAVQWALASRALSAFVYLAMAVIGTALFIPQLAARAMRPAG
jgi:uncharacterized membrane protein YbhN (UPF0104 family)